MQKQRESLKDLELEDEDNREDLEQALELLKEIEDRIKHEKKARHVARASFSTKSHVQRRNEQSKGKLTCFFFFHLECIAYTELTSTSLVESKSQKLQKVQESLKDLELEDEENREDLEEVLELLKGIEDRLSG